MKAIHPVQHVYLMCSHIDIGEKLCWIINGKWS